jgi:uncharacterized membrane protein
MNELTEKILALDAAAYAALKKSAAAVQEVKKEADLKAQRLIEEQQQLFEKQKESDAAALAEKLEAERRRALAALYQKMEVNDRSADIDKQIAYLLSAAKDRVCR